MKIEKDHLLLILIALLAFVFQHGESDQAAIMELALERTRHSLFPGDVLIHYNSMLYPGFFPEIIGYLFHTGDILLAIMLSNGIIRVLLVISMYLLTNELFKNKKIGLITASACIFTKPALATGAIHTSLVPKAFVLPFILLCLYLTIKKRYYLSFFILGILANFHPLDPLNFLAMLSFGLILVYRSWEMFRKLVISGLLALAGALPVIIQKLFFSPSWDIVDREFIILRNYYMFLNNPSFLVVMLKFIPFVLLFFVAMYYKKRDNNDKLILNCSIFVITVIFLNYIILEVLEYNFMFQLYRISKFLVIFGILYGAWFSYFLLIRKGMMQKMSGLLIIFLLIFYPHLLPSYFIQKNIFSKESKMQDWKDIQLWANENTNIYDIFITPPKYNGFRIYSQRGIVGSWKDGAAQLYSRNFSRIWWERMQDLGYEKDYKVRSTCNDPVCSFLKEIWIKIVPPSPEPVGVYGYNLLTDSDFLRISERYNAGYVVTEKPHELGFTQIYENNCFRIYKICDDQYIGL